MPQFGPLFGLGPSIRPNDDAAARATVTGTATGTGPSGGADATRRTLAEERGLPRRRAQPPGSTSPALPSSENVLTTELDRMRLGTRTTLPTIADLPSRHARRDPDARTAASIASLPASVMPRFEAEDMRRFAQPTVLALWPDVRERDLSHFVEQIVLRSHIASDMLTVASYFLHRISERITLARAWPRTPLTHRDNVATSFRSQDERSRQADPDQQLVLHDGKRALLAAIILASASCNDRNYSSKAWAKITGLHHKEINSLTMGLFKLMDGNVNVGITRADRDRYRAYQSELAQATGTQLLHRD